jgi:hypothetical protein
MTLMYYARYTDGNLSESTITRGQLGAGQELEFTVYDEDGDVVDLSSLTTNMKIYVGTLSALKITGGTLTAVSASDGTVKYALIATDFDAEGDAGTYEVELQFANNATIGSATSIIRAGGLTLKVIDTISD